MLGVNWKYNDESKSRKFWSITSDYYIYLGQLFIDFDFKFDQSLGERTSEFELIEDQVDFLIAGLESRLDSLIENFEPNVPLGLTSIPNEFKGKKYNLFVKASRNHKLINGLIRFLRFLIESKTDNRKIIFWGGEMV